MYKGLHAYYNPFEKEVTIGGFQSPQSFILVEPFPANRLVWWKRVTSFAQHTKGHPVRPAGRQSVLLGSQSKPSVNNQVSASKVRTVFNAEKIIKERLEHETVFLMEYQK